MDLSGPFRSEDRSSKNPAVKAQNTHKFWAGGIQQTLLNFKDSLWSHRQTKDSWGTSKIRSVWMMPGVVKTIYR